MRLIVSRKSDFCILGSPLDILIKGLCAVQLGGDGEEFAAGSLGKAADCTMLSAWRSDHVCLGYHLIRSSANGSGGNKVEFAKRKIRILVMKPPVSRLGFF